MLKNTSTRLYIVAALIPLTYYGAAWFFRVEMESREVVMPSWTFDQLPMKLGPWTGKPAELDEEMKASGTASVTNRIYQDEQGRSISFYGAMFNNPQDGVLHSPMNCYRRTGWQFKEEKWETLQLNDQLSIPVNLSRWERKSEKGFERVFVLYWYQLGEHVLFNRWDFGVKVRWAMRDREKWPPIIKVMLHMPISDPDSAKPAILDFATQVAAWENQPKHRQEMGIPAP